MNAVMRLPGMRAALARAAAASALATLGVVALAVGLALGLARLAGHADGDPWPAFLVAAAGLLVRAGAAVVAELLAGRDSRRMVAGLRADLVRRLIADADAVADAGGAGPAAVLAASRLTAATTALSAPCSRGRRR
jgi:ATP-binding cassette subfamily C protein CydCD